MTTNKVSWAKKLGAYTLAVCTPSPVPIPFFNVYLAHKVIQTEEKKYRDSKKPTD